MYTIYMMYMIYMYMIGIFTNVMEGIDSKAKESQ